MPIIIVLVFSGAVLVAGTALAYTIGAAAVFAFYVSGNSTNLAVLPQRLLSQLDVFAFLAMPLFILAGELMNRGGIAERLINFSMSVVGRLKGGLGHVNILTSVFFAGISGSAVSDAAALSNTLVPEMERRGYTRAYAAAITSASSIIGPIIPPSMILIFYGALMETPVAALFAAGIVPGLLLAAVLLVLNGYFAYRNDHPGGREMEIPAFWPSLLQALPAFSLPVIVLGGTLFGFMTPAEAAAIAVVAAFAIGAASRRLGWNDIGECLKRTGILLGAIFIILCAISSFSYLAALEQWPQKLSEIVVELSVSKMEYLFVTNAVFLVAGMFIDVKAAVALFAPVMVPVAISLGVDPVHLGIIVCFNITVGLLTPPIGGILIIVSTVVDINYWHLMRATIPFLIAELCLLAILTIFPEITLTLPRMLGLM